MSEIIGEVSENNAENFALNLTNTQTPQELITFQADDNILEMRRQRAIPSLQAKLAAFVTFFQNSVPIKGDLPIYYVDASALVDEIPAARAPDDISEECLNKSYTRIEFFENMPCANGVPIWERLEGEPVSHYNMFKEYREMRFSPNSHFGLRSMAKVAEAYNVTVPFLNTLSKIYHWGLRIKSFDKYKEFELAYKRKQTAEKLESVHAKHAEALLDQAMDYFLANPEDMTAKVAIEMVELGLKYGRISAGLPGDRPGIVDQPQTTGHGNNAGGAPSPFQYTQIAINNGSNGSASSTEVNVVSGVNQDPEFADSEVGRELASRSKEPSKILEILAVLKNSNAMKVAVDVHLNGDKPTEDDGDSIDGRSTYEVDEPGVINVTPEETETK